MKKYSKYKDSGIAWIGEVPEHWEVIKMRFLSSFKTGDKDTINKEDDGIYPFYVRSPKVERINTYSYEGEAVLMAGDGVGAGKVIHYVNGKFDYHQRVYNFHKIKKTQPYLLYLFLQSFFSYKIEEGGAKNTVDSVRLPMIKDFPIVIPSLSEQKQIAKYLDWKCGEVDRIVEVRERQIKLLGELRTSVINRAVTRGLDPNAPLKDSGIEWIGQIPKHWEVRKISRIFSRIGSGTTPKSGNEDYYAENGENWLQTGDLNDSYIYETSKKITKKALDEHSLRFYSEGSIVMAMYGATIGKLGLLNISTTTNQACCVMSGNKICHSKYGFNTLLAARTHILTLAYGGGQPNISQDTIKTIKLPVPLIEEQQQIADYLDKKTAEIDSTIEKFKTQIDKIKEYRQALITEVVTGKIDVRGIEIPASKSN